MFIVQNQTTSRPKSRRTMKLKNYSLAVAALIFVTNGACLAQSQPPQLPDTAVGNQASKIGYDA